MNDPRVALKLAVYYTAGSLALLAIKAVTGDDQLMLRAMIHAGPGIVLWGGWLWMRAVY